MLYKLFFAFAAGFHPLPLDAREAPALISWRAGATMSFSDLCRDSRLFAGLMIGAGAIVVILIVIALFGL